jgi:hypothetical protein
MVQAGGDWETACSCLGSIRMRPMAIYRLLKFAAFDPEMIASMTAAYEDALRVLRLADRQDPITELVAKKIIEIAQLGESDPARIREQALKELGISPERFS